MISHLLRRLDVHQGFAVVVVEVGSGEAAELVRAFARQVCPCATRTDCAGDRWAVSLAFPDTRPEAPRHVYEFLQVRCLARCTKWDIRGVLLDERGVARRVPA